jgi:hypothetical protein
VAHLLVSFLCLFLLARKAVATMIPAAAKCMIDERSTHDAAIEFATNA